MKNYLSEKTFQEYINLLKIDSRSNDKEKVTEAGDYVVELMQDLPITWERVVRNGAAPLIIGKSKINKKICPIFYSLLTTT